jgi:penicillin-insensitive murein DD-endopeptidase
MHRGIGRGIVYLGALLVGLLAASTAAAKPGPHRRTTAHEAAAGSTTPAADKGGGERSPSPRARRAEREEPPTAHKAKGAPTRADKHAEHKPRKESGKSLGAPNHGKLEDGVLLHGSKTLRLTKGSRAFGLSQLTYALEHASAAVVRKTKGSSMLVGDLSARGGGFLSAHKSHQSGRDADIAFYAETSKGKPVSLNRFVAFDGAGRAKDGTRVFFDDARNWAMMEDLLQSDVVKVRYLFITNELRARLLRYAASKGVSRDLYLRAAAAMNSPEAADPHDGHVHLRISCPEAQRGTCIEESIPAYSGRVAPGGAGVSPDAAPEDADPPGPADGQPVPDAAPAGNPAPHGSPPAALPAAAPAAPPAAPPAVPAPSAAAPPAPSAPPAILAQPRLRP